MHELIPRYSLLADTLPPGSDINSSIIFIISNFLINAIILSVVYIILKKAFLLKSLKFWDYIILVTIGGFLIDFIFVVGNYYLSYLAWIFIIITSLVLLIYNYYLSKMFFKPTSREALLVGLVMGILTNPIIGVSLYGYLSVNYIHFIYHPVVAPR